MADKKSLRRSLLAARQSMPPDEWRLRSDRLCEQIRRSPWFQAAQTVLTYSSIRNEPDLSPLLQAEESGTTLWRQRRWGLPRCVDRTMVWHLWSLDFPLQPGAFGILEPSEDFPILDPSQVDLILVPSVACDRLGYRLGYGGGFYDRMLSDPAWADKRAIGIVFADAYLDALPHDDWDRPLHGICTDAGWIDLT